MKCTGCGQKTINNNDNISDCMSIGLFMKLVDVKMVFCFMHSLHIKMYVQY